MLSWKDVMVTKERNKDLLREAEQARLIHQVRAANEAASVWHKVKGLFGGTSETQQPAEGVSCVSSLETAG
jgi:hypothetical protein